MTAKKITYNMLWEACACYSGMQPFQDTFPDGVVPTVALAEQFADVFDWLWAGEELLREEFREAFITANVAAGNARSAATEPTANEYYRVEQKAYMEYQAALGAIGSLVWGDPRRRALQDAYEQQTNGALEASRKASAEANSVYNRRVAVAFVEQWTAQSEKEGGEEG